MKLLISTALGTALLVAAPALADKSAVLENYANIALAKYEDSLTTAQSLRQRTKYASFLQLTCFSETGASR